MARSKDPIVITEAQESLPDQLRKRQIRYALMMGLRVVCLVAAVVVFAAQPPLTPVWVTLCILGMVFLPWMAVLIANDRPPKKASQLRTKLHGHPRPDRAITSGQSSDEVVTGEIIDPKHL
jgi:Flp pilus assembly protein TadB